MQDHSDPIKLESLAEYVRRIIYQKKLTILEVARKSDGRITQGYVGGIVQGLHSNPSLEKLKALAQVFTWTRQKSLVWPAGYPWLKPKEGIPSSARWM
jgi:transcriptional regulator with XRE-family HTH domain